MAMIPVDIPYMFQKLDLGNDSTSDLQLMKQGMREHISDVGGCKGEDIEMLNKMLSTELKTEQKRDKSQAATVVLIEEMGNTLGILAKRIAQLKEEKIALKALEQEKKAVRQMEINVKEEAIQRRKDMRILMWDKLMKLHDRLCRLKPHTILWGGPINASSGRQSEGQVFKFLLNDMLKVQDALLAANKALGVTIPNNDLLENDQTTKNIKAQLETPREEFWQKHKSIG